MTGKGGSIFYWNSWNSGFVCSLGALFRRHELAWEILRYLRYTLIGLWIAWGSPLLFEKLGVGVIKPYLPPQSSAQR